MSAPSKAQVLLTDAMAAYDRGPDQEWFDAAPTDVLAFLWGVACTDIYSAAWDDEVFDALAKRGWFDATCDVYVTRTGWANPVKCGAPAVTQVGPTAYCADHPRQTV